ncbi:unnamed protein product [marine sediment metagenome]|uniref:Uncharacterized protein n=1 Tax=marine sediment metagenome TaxID=412755 RepID=X1AKK1_9ZZZZ
MDKMLAAVFHKGDKIGGEIKLEEVDIPQITKSDQVLVEIKACGIAIFVKYKLKCLRDKI